MRNLHKVALTVATFFVGMNAAMAASPVGQWNVTFFFEPGLIQGATQGICFQPDGSWFATTFAGWQGGWVQKGDRFRWYGTTGSTLTSTFGAFDSNGTIGGGEYTSIFAVNGFTSSRGDWHAAFVGSSCGARAATAGHVARAGDPTK